MPNNVYDRAGLVFTYTRKREYRPKNWVGREFDWRNFKNKGVWRKARKQHTCPECKQPIMPGERYWEDMTVLNEFIHGRHYHAKCIEEGSPAYGLVDPRSNPDYEGRD